MKSRPHRKLDRGWVSVWVDAGVPWEMVEDLVLESYRSVALERMLRALEG